MTYATCHRCHTVGRAYGSDGLPRGWTRIPTASATTVGRAHVRSATSSRSGGRSGTP